jgi:Asp-tRNA(Asn)/Glu-tRNA(Gln) amidotransferase A subunit family amidase
MTRLALGKIPKTYTAFLDPEGLKHARIGIVVEVLGDKPEHEPVNKVFAQAVAQLEALGATVFPVRIPNLNDYRAQGTDLYEAYALLQSWFAELGPDAPYHSVEEFLEKGTYNKEIVPRILEQKKFSGPEHRAEYERRLLKMHEFRAVLVDLMDRYALDGLVYPIQMKLVAQHTDRNTDRNGFLASIAMLPAINVPAGYSPPTAEAPNGVPIGMDILGRPFDEGRLLRLAYAWELHGWKKMKPPFTP